MLYRVLCIHYTQKHPMTVSIKSKDKIWSTGHEVYSILEVGVL